MNHRSGVVFQFLVLTITLLAAKTAVACVCPDRDDTVLGKFEEAQFVVIAKVIAFERTPHPQTTRTKMVIEKVYKGNLRVGEEMIFGQGESGSCFEDFDNRHIATKFLFYLRQNEKTPRVWYADRCGRAKPLPGFDTEHVEDAADDLSYLEKMDKVTGKTRISGTLISYLWSPSHGGADFKRVAGGKVRLIREKEIYEAETNKDGVYEIYDLPPGRYTVEPKIPKGWAIDDLSAWGGGGSGGREDNEQSQLTLRKGRHAYFDFFFKSDSRLRGRVLNPFGNPMGHACVNLIPTRGEVSKYFNAIDCTKQDGSFEIDEIPFGSYFIVVNNDDRISSYQPFRRFYYPDVFERKNARAVKIVEGHDPEAVEIHVPEMREVVALQGVFLSADGKPVTRATVSFKPEKTDELTDGNAFTRTDENGKFSLIVLKGLKGRLLGEVTLDESQFKDCPQVIALLRKNGQIDWRDEKTDAVELQTQGGINNIDLRLPFPSCKGQKIVSRMKID